MSAADALYRVTAFGPNLDLGSVTVTIANNCPKNFGDLALPSGN